MPDQGQFRAEALWMRKLVDALWQGESRNFQRSRDLGFAPGVLPRPDSCHGMLPLAYEDDGARTLPFIDVRDATRKRDMKAFLRAAGQVHFERRRSLRPKDVVIGYRRRLFDETARRLSAKLHERGLAASYDELILVPGEGWEAPLQEAVATAHLIVFLLDV